MSADLSCPVCGAEFDLAVLFKSEESRRTFDRLTANCSPLKARLAQYAALAKPPKHKLDTDKALRIIKMLLPDIERGAITRNGRDWPAPLSAWAQAIDQMLERRNAGTLELPMKGHGYLYSILQGMADKAEAAAEQQREQDHRLRPQRDTVQVRGQALPIGEALQVVYAGKDPALAEIDARNQRAAPMPDHIRKQIDQMKKGQTP